MKIFKRINKNIFEKKVITIIIAVLLSFNITTVYSSKIIMPIKSQEKSQPKIPAFIDAEGGGMWTTGARGAENPEIYHVTNLNDSGVGSFRDAISKGDRFIVFDIGGNIKLKTPIKVKNINNLTILGQTAPGDGISIEGESVNIHHSNNIIIRYLRFRMASKIWEDDTLSIQQGDNIIVDHCSMSWSVDECSTLSAVKNATIQWCIISEALHNSVHSEGAHSMGTMWGGINFTAHHNLLASNQTRNPAITSGSGTQTYNDNKASDTDSMINIRNNVIYNWGGEGYGASNGTRVNFINNYYRPGPGTKENSKNIMFNIIGTPDSSPSLPENGGTYGGGKGVRGWSATIYLEGNYIENADDVNKDNWKGIKIDSTVGSWEGSYIKCKDISDGIYVDGILKSNNEYLDDYPIITQKANTAYDEVLKYAGASVKRDSIDKRVINDVINKTAPTGSISGIGFIDSPDDVGGFANLDKGIKKSDIDNDGIPDIWEDENGLDKTNPSDALKINDDGYTMIEKYSEELAVHENNKLIDKSELRNTIYSALKMNKYDYNIKSWNNMQTALNEAKESVSIVYPNQSDIDIAHKNLKNAIELLEPENKYELRIEIEKAKEIDLKQYIEDSYKSLKDIIASAELVYNNDNFTQTDIDNAINSLKDAINKLEINYRNELNNLINKAENEDQVSYTIQSMENLIDEINNSKDLIKNPEATNDELKERYEELKLAHSSLEKETDVYSRFTGDLENLICYRLKNGYHGKFILRAGDATCEIKKNIGDNDTNALLINDTVLDRASITHRLSKKLNGLVKVEADYYFKDEPQGYNMLLRLSDSDLIDNGAGIFLNLNTKRTNSKTYLEIDNSGEYIDCSNVIFEKSKWYNIEALIDTYKKEYTIYINGNEIKKGIIKASVSNNSDFGIISYQIATPGKPIQTLAIDNLKTEVIGNKDKLKILIDKAKSINPKMYTEESYTNVLNNLELAEEQYNSSVFVQGDDMKIILEALENSINSLKRDGKGYELSELINKASNINQMNYTTESVENLVNALRTAKDILTNVSATDTNIEIEYTKLNEAYNSLNKNIDNSKISGDFEKLSCIGIGSGRYGKYNCNFDNNLCDIRQNIGNNATKVLWMDNTLSSNRAYIDYILSDSYKITGKINIEADYYFEKKPKVTTILLGLTDYNFNGNSLNFLTITTGTVNTDLCLRVNHLDKDINDFTDVIFKTGEWYNIKVTLDTINRECTVYVNNKEITKMPLKYISNDDELGLNKFRIATSGKDIMAIDNIKSEIVGDMDNLKSAVYEAKKLNPKIYKEESYNKLKNILGLAENVCNGSNYVQADELRSMYGVLNNTINMIKKSIKSSGCKFENYEFIGEWISSGEIEIKGDIINYSSEKEDLLLIATSFENGVLVDYNLKNINVDELNSVDDIITKVKLGNNISNCNIKVFLWRRNSLEPLMPCIEKNKKV